MQAQLTTEAALPHDGTAGTLVGRAWVPGAPPGPAVVALRADGVFDLSHVAPTMSDLLNAEEPSALARSPGERLGDVASILANSAYDRRSAELAFLLAPCDLQALKAAGVTFAASMLERVIEEQARGDASKAEAIRRTIKTMIGSDLSKIKPGSAAAMRLKAHLLEQNAWSQYLEVGIGPDAEVFTKAPPMAAVGTGSEIGIRADSTWNNPEPELVVAVNARGEIVGAALGNDVNLRDFEGRSALLLGRAKDNNASCAIGPFVRLFDDHFGIDDARGLEISLTVAGKDGFRMEGSSTLREISRDPLDLVAQTINRNHQYPDGLALFTGTMFAPVEDRGAPGAGFTHREGDIVTIAAPQLGALANRVTTSDKAPPWTFGAGALIRNLAARKLI